MDRTRWIDSSRRFRGEWYGGWGRQRGYCPRTSELAAGCHGSGSNGSRGGAVQRPAVSGQRSTRLHLSAIQTRPVSSSAPRNGTDDKRSVCNSLPCRWSIGVHGTLLVEVILPDARLAVPGCNGGMVEWRCAKQPGSPGGAPETSMSLCTLPAVRI